MKQKPCALRISISVLFLLGTMTCNTMKENTYFDVQGHRGWKGHYPENTLPGFIAALDLGVHTLECDAVITREKEVILSHEPFFSHHICLDSLGQAIPKEEERHHNIFHMTYSEIEQYDCGSKVVDGYPDQRKLRVVKPRLVEMIRHCEQHASDTGRPLPYYNIEIKARDEWVNAFHPPIKEYADLVLGVIRSQGILHRATIQSFHIGTLQYLHETYPEVNLVYLVANQSGFEDNIKALGFIPEVYSPYYELVTEKLIAYSKTQKMKIIPWTVNETEDMSNLLSMNVDGIISDYPNLLLSLIAQRK